MVSKEELKLKLKNEIVFDDRGNRCVYINGIQFANRKQANWVFAVLSNWNAQCILNGGSDILKYSIYDTGITYNLQKALELKGVIAHHQNVADCIIKALSRIGDVTGDDDIVVIDEMIDVLSKDRMSKITSGDDDVNGWDILLKWYVIKSVDPVKCYLEELRNVILADDEL